MSKTTERSSMWEAKCGANHLPFLFKWKEGLCRLSVPTRSRDRRGYLHKPAADSLWHRRVIKARRCPRRAARFGVQNREDVEFLRAEGGLKMGVCHLEVWLYDASAEPGKALKERENLSVSAPFRLDMEALILTWYWLRDRRGWPTSPDWIISAGCCLNGTKKRDTALIGRVLSNKRDN